MDELASKKNQKRNLYILIATLIACSLVYRLLGDYDYKQTSLLFVGIPALLAILMVKYTNTPRTAYGIVFKAITLFLLLSSILLGEGVLCIIFAAPIFYGVAAILVAIHEYLHKRDKSNLSAFFIIPTILVLAQPTEINRIPDMQTQVSTIVFDHKTSINAFTKIPDFQENYPNFFRIGFPTPIGITGAGMEIGDTRDIQFKSSTKGIGTLSLEIIEKSPQSITFKPIHDDTHISHWLSWNEMKIELIEENESQTIVKWTTKYQCDLGPSWYFEPLENIAVQVMNKHLINTYFDE